MSGLKSWGPQCARRAKHHKVLRVVEEIVVLKINKKFLKYNA
jgi:hypothetical protein